MIGDYDEPDEERRFRRIIEVYFLILYGKVKTERDYLLDTGLPLFRGSRPTERNKAGRKRHDLLDIAAQFGVAEDDAKRIKRCVYQRFNRAKTRERKREYDKSPLGSRRIGRGELKAA